MNVRLAEEVMSEEHFCSHMGSRLNDPAILDKFKQIGVCWFFLPDSYSEPGNMFRTFLTGDLGGTETRQSSFSIVLHFV